MALALSANAASDSSPAIAEAVTGSTLNQATSGPPKTFGKLAYICAGGPKAGDDGPLLAAVKTLTGNEPAGADLIDLRRLWAEAQALSGRERTFWLK